ncbi:MAG: circularly permuted type 2 ATP-grasp protein, partial [Rhodoferax sp.]
MNHAPASPTAEATAPVTALAHALASPPAAPGHFDELRGYTPDGGTAPAFATHSIATNAGITDVWSQFFAHCETDGLGDLAQRNARLQRQFHDNGVASNVHADHGGPQRPWSPGLLPLILSPESWQQIEAGVAQRMRLLDRILADVYGPQQLLARRLLPPALVQGHPGYARALHGMAPVGGTHLHLAAFDLARGPDGHWWLVSQHTQAPAGLGHLLENRLAVSRLFPMAFDHLQVQHLGSTYRALLHGLRHMSPAGQDAHIALLTPGPYSALYSEHAYLAHHLGLPLVEGRDLVVRDLRLYLKTLRGLVPIHGLLKHMDDAYLDPLELRPDSTLGVPGLLQAMRAGHVLVANAPGSAFLESPALQGFLPALSQHLLGEELRLPALPTWWCGERPALEDALPRLAHGVIKPTYPASTHHNHFETVQGRRLSPEEREAWATRLRQHGDDHTVQAEIALAQMPTWSTPDTPPNTAGLMPRPFILRVFAVSDGPQSWR